MRFTNAALVVLLQHSPLAPSLAFSSIPKFSSDRQRSYSLEKELVANGFVNEDDGRDTEWGHEVAASSGARRSALYMSKSDLDLSDLDDARAESEKPRGGKGSLAASILGVASASKVSYGDRAILLFYL